MTKITLDRKYAARKPGDEMEVSELELDALEALGIARRPTAAEDEPHPEPEVEQEEPPPAIPLNPPPEALPVDQVEADEVHE